MPSLAHYGCNMEEEINMYHLFTQKPALTQCTLAGGRNQFATQAAVSSEDNLLGCGNTSEE